MHLTARLEEWLSYVLHIPYTRTKPNRSSVFKANSSISSTSLIFTLLVASFVSSANASFYEKYKEMSTEEAIAACPKEKLTKVPKRKMDGILEVDFTNQSEICLAAFMKTQSSRYLVVLSERQEVPWRSATLDSARAINVQSRQTIFEFVQKQTLPCTSKITASGR